MLQENLAAAIATALGVVAPLPGLPRQDPWETTTGRGFATSVTPFSAGA